MPFPDDIGVKLVCPKCHTDLVRDGASFVCASATCRLRYPIMDDIPKFLIEEAIEVPLEDWTAIVRDADGRPRT